MDKGLLEQIRGAETEGWKLCVGCYGQPSKFFVHTEQPQPQDTDLSEETLEVFLGFIGELEKYRTEHPQQPGMATQAEYLHSLVVAAGYHRCPKRR